MITGRSNHNCNVYRQGSRFRVKETSQILERYSVKVKAIMKQKELVMLGQMYLPMIEYPKHDWHSAFGHRWLCYSHNFHLEPTTYITNKFEHKSNKSANFLRFSNEQNFPSTNVCFLYQLMSQGRILGTRCLRDPSI